MMCHRPGAGRVTGAVVCFALLAVATASAAAAAEEKRDGKEEEGVEEVEGREFEEGEEASMGVNESSISLGSTSVTAQSSTRPGGRAAVCATTTAAAPLPAAPNAVHALGSDGGVVEGVHDQARAPGDERCVGGDVAAHAHAHGVHHTTATAAAADANTTTSSAAATATFTSTVTSSNTVPIMDSPCERGTRRSPSAGGLYFHAFHLHPSVRRSDANGGAYPVAVSTCGHPHPTTATKLETSRHRQPRACSELGALTRGATWCAACQRPRSRSRPHRALASADVLLRCECLRGAAAASSRFGAACGDKAPGRCAAGQEQ